MNASINTYEDLLQEKERLQALLQSQKQVVREDIRQIKEELAPVKSAVNFIGKMATREPGNPLLNSAVDTVIDLVVKKLVLGRAGWFTRLAVPFVMKNFASHAIDEKKDAILRKIFSWFGKKKNHDDTQVEGNGKMHEVTEDDEVED